MRPQAKKELQKDILEILLVVAAACVLAGSVHFSLVRRFVGGEFRQSFLDLKKYEGLRFIGGDEAEDLFAAGEALFIDSRSRLDFAAGHIPGALSIPLEEVKGEINKKRPIQNLFTLPRDKVLVVYCEGGDCQTSIGLARTIYDFGFKEVRVFEGGWAEWIARGLPVEESK